MTPSLLVFRKYAFSALRNNLNVIRQFRGYSSTTLPPRIGIVGSGPAGFYTAQYILKVSQTIFI